MPHGPLSAVLEFLQKTRASHELRGLADAELLTRFLTDQEEGAFAALVHRHGPMIMGVCQRILGERHGAEDAFQATFLVLVRRAGTIHKNRPLANWLYGVARRVALKARAQTAMRQVHERELMQMSRTTPDDDVTWQELRSVLDEEIGQLPEALPVPYRPLSLAGPELRTRRAATRLPQEFPRQPLEPRPRAAAATTHQTWHHPIIRHPDRCVDRENGCGCSRAHADDQHRQSGCERGDWRQRSGKHSVGKSDCTCGGSHARHARAWREIGSDGDACTGRHRRWSRRLPSRLRHHAAGAELIGSRLGYALAQTNAPAGVEERSTKEGSSPHRRPLR